MDWSRAKTIIIIALIATNIFLLYTLYVVPQGAEDEIDAASVEKALKLRDISLETEIPKLRPELAPLTVEYASEGAGEGFSQHSFLKEDPEEATDGAYAKLCEDIMESLGIDIKYAVLDSFERKNIGGVESASLKYRCEAEGIVLDMSSFECRFENGRLREFRNEWIAPLAVGRVKDRILGASYSLMDFMAEAGALSDSGLAIDKIELVYWLNREGYESGSAATDTALPAWKISWRERNGGKSGAWYGIAVEQEDI